jgi:hypothetical protein
MYSSAWSDRAYGIVLFFLCWILPLFVIFFSYSGIILHTRPSTENLLSGTKTFRQTRREKVSRESDHMERWHTKWQKKRKVIIGLNIRYSIYRYTEKSNTSFWLNNKVIITD